MGLTVAATNRKPTNREQRGASFTIGWPAALVHPDPS